MSKYLKDLLTRDIQRRLEGVQDALIVKVEGLTSLANNQLRKELTQKNIQVLVVKNSMARRALHGTPLAIALEDISGPAAVVWGGEDLITVAKEIIRLGKEKKYEKMQPKGGAMDGSRLGAEEVEAVSKWPTRGEQLSILVGQILSPGAQLAGALTAVGGKLASQIEKKAEGGEEAEGGETPAEGAAEAAPA